MFSVIIHFLMLKTVMVVVSMIVSHPQAVPWCLGLSLSSNQWLCSWLVDQSEAERGGYFRRNSGIHDDAAGCKTLPFSTCSRVSVNLLFLPQNLHWPHILFNLHSADNDSNAKLLLMHLSASQCMAYSMRCMLPKVSILKNTQWILSFFITHRWSLPSSNIPPT